MLSKSTYQHGSPSRIGVLLINLGTPDAPNAQALRPYLKEFLSNRRVIEIPRIIWWPILHGFILPFRPKESAEKYAKIWLPEGSPLKVHTERQTKLLREALQSRLGNPPHRVAETPMGMINAIGLQNPGVGKVVREILPTLDFTETRFIANASGSTIEEYIEVVSKFDDSPIDAIEINISCPNVKEGGVQFGNSPDMSARVVEACRAVKGLAPIALLFLRF